MALVRDVPIDVKIITFFSVSGRTRRLTLPRMRYTFPTGGVELCFVRHVSSCDTAGSYGHVSVTAPSCVYLSTRT